MIDKAITTAFNAGKYERIIPILQNLLQQGNIDSELYYMLSFSLFQRGKFTQSLDVASTGLIEFSDDMRLEENILLIKFSLGETENILDKISYLHEVQNYQSEYLCNLECQVYVDIFGNYNKALTLYKSYIDIYPNSGVLKYYFGLLYYKRGDYKIAMKLFYDSLDLDFLYAYYGLVKCLKQDSGLCINTQYFIDYFSHKTELRNDFTCLGNIFYELGEYNIALKYFSESLNNISTDYCTYNGIGNILHKIGNYEESKQYFMRALKMRRNDTYAYNGLGNNFYSQKDYRKALGFYLKGYKPGSENAYHLYKIGMCYYFLSEFVLSLEFLEKSMKYNNQNFMAKRYFKKTQMKLGK